jgi:hypothetical protein
MGNTKTKIIEIDNLTRSKYLPNIKTSEDIEAAIKALIALMTLK